MDNQPLLEWCTLCSDELKTNIRWAKNKLPKLFVDATFHSVSSKAKVNISLTPKIYIVLKKMEFMINIKEQSDNKQLL